MAHANERLDLLRAKLQSGEDVIQTKAQLSVEMDHFRQVTSKQKPPTTPEGSKPAL